MDHTDQLPAAPFPPAAEPAPVPHRPSLWRPALAGGLAGGVLAASVAVPVTWQLVDGRSEAASAETSPGQRPDDQQEGPGWFDGNLDPRGPGDTSGAEGTAATDEQSRGVLLIETQTRAGSGAGTGLVLSSEGLALTNYHVIEGSTAVRAEVAATGESHEVEVLGFDESADIALLRLVGAEDLDTIDPDDDGADVEDEVTAVGNARGGGALLAAEGEVTELDSRITTQDGFGPGASADRLEGLIETSAAAVPGYSGGPTYDDEGEVLGITTAAAGDASQSFAVPIDDALEVAGRIEDGDEGGSVQIGPSAWLGISVADGGSGAGVADVEAGSPADELGLADGAVITGLDGAAVGSVEDLLDEMARHEPGDSVEVTWTDPDGSLRTGDVELGESPVH
jgi:S1-C subfamily serine protease